MKIEKTQSVFKSVALAVQAAADLMSTACKNLPASLIASRVWGLSKTNDSSKSIPVVRLASVISSDDHARKRSRLQSLRLQLALAHRSMQSHQYKVNSLRSSIQSDKRVLIRLSSAVLSPEDKAVKKVEVEMKIQNKEAELAAAEANLLTAVATVASCDASIRQEG